MDTEALEAQARGGDAPAFGSLARQWDSSLRAVVWSVVRSADATDDVMQAAYEKAFRSISGFRGGSSLKTWLHSICWRTAIDHVRYEGRRRHQPLDQVGDVAAEASTSSAALDRVELASVLERLDPDVRSLLMLTAGLGYSFDEVAEIVDMPRGTVASKVGRARRSLRLAESAEDGGRL